MMDGKVETTEYIRYLNNIQNVFDLYKERL
jgi:hypothetical protein